MQKWTPVKNKANSLFGMSYEEVLAAVQKEAYLLAFLTADRQTPEICMEAVQCAGLALQYVVEQTPEICLEAVRENGYALQFVKEQTLEICLAAMLENPFVLQYVSDEFYDQVPSEQS